MGLQQSGDRLKKGRFPGAVGSDEGDHLPVLDLKGNALEGLTCP